MGQYDIDWDAALEDAADNNTNAAIPASDYDIEVIKAEATTFQSGSIGIKLTARVTTGPHTDRWLFDNLVFKEGPARNITVKNLVALGIDRDWLRSQNPSLSVLSDKLVGLTATASVGVRQWQGDERNEIKGYKAGSAGATPSVPQASDPATVQATPPEPESPAASSATEAPPKPF